MTSETRGPRPGDDASAESRPPASSGGSRPKAANGGTARETPEQGRDDQRSESRPPARLGGLLYRWAPALFWSAAAGLALLLQARAGDGGAGDWARGDGATALGAALAAIALPALVAMLGVRRDRFRALGIRALGVDALATDLATSGAAGFTPVGSGTFGAIAALPLGAYLPLLAPPLRAAALLAGTGASVLATHRYLALKQRQQSGAAGGGRSAGHDKALDPSEVVVDESIGVLLALAFVPWDPIWASAAFVLFRALDITKPGPVGWAERRLPGAWAVVFDDVLAGLGAGAALAAVRAFL